jgi:hypothetical protein
VFISFHYTITNTAWVRTRLCKLQKWCTRLAAASDKDYQFLAHGRWFSLGTPASSTTKTGCHDIAEKLLKVALKHQNSNSLVQIHFYLSRVSGMSVSMKTVSMNSLNPVSLVPGFGHVG